jgi:hypothetical protein
MKLPPAGSRVASLQGFLSKNERVIGGAKRRPAAAVRAGAASLVFVGYA